MTLTLQRFVMSVSLYSVLITASLFGQSTLPEGWQQLHPNEFVAEVKTLQANGPIDTSTQQAINSHAAQFLTATDAVTSATYETLTSLVRWGKSELTAEQMSSVTNQLAARQDSVGTMPYLELRHKVAAMYLAGAPFEQRSAQVATWLNADETGLGAVWEREFAWLYDMLSYPHLSNGSFSVVWSGTVTVPRTGSYVFSISPINVNAAWQSFFIRNNWKVTIGGQQVLGTTAEQWQTTSPALELTAGEPVDLLVEVDYAVSRPAIDALHAMLFWEGPGISRQIVPTGVLKTPDGSRQGLLGQYSVVVNGSPATIDRVDQNIDFVWATGRRIIAEDQLTQNALRTQIYNRCMDANYLSRCETAASDAHRHAFLYDVLLTECLTTAQRRAFLRELLQRPELLRPLSPNEAVAFFKAFRFGAEDEALAVFGLWCELHADLPAELPDPPNERGYFDANRLEFHDLARCIVQQYPAHAERLEAEYLERADGSCSLPVAYTLAYAYQDQGRIGEWIEKLEDRLADQALTGNQRTSWLIARAMAQEIRRGRPSFFETGPEQLFAGQGWLDEASLTAESAAVQARLSKERAARLTATHDWEAAQAELEAAGLLDWNQKLSLLRQQATAEQSQEEAAAHAAYVTELERRRQMAAARGDSAAEQQYLQLISTAEAASTQ